MCAVWNTVNLIYNIRLRAETRRAKKTMMNRVCGPLLLGLGLLGRCAMAERAKDCSEEDLLEWEAIAMQTVRRFNFIMHHPDVQAHINRLSVNERIAINLAAIPLRTEIQRLWDRDHGIQTTSNSISEKSLRSIKCLWEMVDIAVDAQPANGFVTKRECTSILDDLRRRINRFHPT
ncbi:MAG: hypothetical protein M1819_006372 [Sarea resinae]|nr:MAG: hypothetical protein M1819_006372 [Sarea resinae]